jgi:glycerol-3-phosphate dehydrogenase subunit B
MRPDVIVIGAGLAGLTAAARLGEAGAEVLVLAKGVGSTYLSPTTIDVLGYTGDGDGGGPSLVENPLDALPGLPAEHPYHLVGGRGVTQAVDWFKGCIAAGPLAPYAYMGDPSSNLLLPTAAGAVKPSAVVPESMAGGDVRDGGRICVVGFRALKDLHPALLADNLSRTAQGVEARSLELDLKPEGRTEHNALGFARAFDDASFRGQVVSLVSRGIYSGERVAFPAVLGSAAPHTVWSELEARLERSVFEIATLPPSVPGIRVFASLRHAVTAAGGRIIVNAVVTGVERDGHRAGELRVRLGLREVTHRADHVVLATGGFSAGGLELDSTWHAREVALGLPVTGVPGPGQERFKPGYFDDHPMARAGLSVDADQRPLDEGGERVFENVVVAGASLAGAVPWKEKSGDGLALATGFRAAELILAEGRLGRASVSTTAEARA